MTAEAAANERAAALASHPYAYLTYSHVSITCVARTGAQCSECTISASYVWRKGCRHEMELLVPAKFVAQKSVHNYSQTRGKPHTESEQHYAPTHQGTMYNRSCEECITLRSIRALSDAHGVVSRYHSMCCTSECAFMRPSMQVKHRQRSTDIPHQQTPTLVAVFDL
jgi:hypothetical protein